MGVGPKMKVQVGFWEFVGKRGNGPNIPNGKTMRIILHLSYAQCPPQGAWRP